MKDLLDEIQMLYKYFNDEKYVFFALFLLSIIYIFITEKNKKIKDFFVGFSVFILLVIWNPIGIYVLNKFINIGSMYRIYYMLPTCVSIAYALTLLIRSCHNKIEKFIVFTCSMILIPFFGECIFNETTTIKVNNLYKLPDDTVEVAYAIASDTETTDKKAMVPYFMSAQIRQVCPEIKLCYSRIIFNPKDENGNSLPHDTDDPANYEPVQNLNSGNVAYVTDYCKKQKANYIVFDKNVTLNDNIEKYGFKLFTETSNHKIYKIVSNDKK